ncbi:MAG: diguanylate cyclase [Planctomycetota bacterium]
MYFGLSDVICIGLGASGGAALGWKLRGVRAKRDPVWNSDRAFVGQTLADLQHAADEARQVVDVHKRRLKELEDLLEKESAQGGGNTELISGLIDDNKRLINQLDDIEASLGKREEEIQWWLREHPPKKSKAKQKLKPTADERVLDDLRQIAKQVSSTVKRHREDVASCNDEAEKPSSSSTDIVSAVGSLIAAATQMQEDIVEADRKLQAQSVALESQAITSVTDALTGLMNRGEFDREAQRCVDFLANNGRPFAIVLIDLDDFKSVNDRFGHQAGDAVLREASGVLSAQTRQTDFLARYGGEELAWRVLDVDTDSLQRITLRVLQDIRASETRSRTDSIRVTASMGVAVAAQGESREDVVERADQALYAAKRGGRDRVCFHNGKECVDWGSEPPKEQEQARNQTGKQRRSADKITSKKVDASSGAKLGDTARALLSSRTVFFHSVSRSLALWKRGGPSSTVVLLHVDAGNSVTPGSDAAHALHDAIARLLDANTREMDHCCDFDSGIYAVLLQQMSVADAVMVAARIRTAATQVKIAVEGKARVSVKGSVGVAEGCVTDTAVELISRATTALEAAARTGDAAVFVSHASGKTVAVPLKSPKQVN